MENVYAAPQSDVVEVAQGGVSGFERFSTWYVLLLAIVTLGLYIPYWLYSRTKVLNVQSEDQISSGFVWATLLLYVLALCASIASAAAGPEVSELVLVESGASLIANVFMIVWVFKFRNRLQKLIAPLQLKTNPVLTFFLQAFYMQYKVNEAIDKQG